MAAMIHEAIGRLNTPGPTRGVRRCRFVGYFAVIEPTHRLEVPSSKLWA